MRASIYACEQLCIRASMYAAEHVQRPAPTQAGAYTGERARGEHPHRRPRRVCEGGLAAACRACEGGLAAACRACEGGLAAACRACEGGASQGPGTRTRRGGEGARVLLHASAPTCCTHIDAYARAHVVASCTCACSQGSRGGGGRRSAVREGDRETRREGRMGGRFTVCAVWPSMALPSPSIRASAQYHSTHAPHPRV
jgi:hypothetical protein